MSSRLTVLSGPAGVGKSTVVAVLREKFPALWHSVSVTTRAARPGELDGIHYWFVDRTRFDQLRDGGELLEHADYTGNGYGTPREPVEARLAQGVPVLLEIDLEGARQVRRLLPDAQLVFLVPPSWDELERRLRGRGTEAPAVIARRLERARVELAAEDEFDVSVLSADTGEAAARIAELAGAG